MYVYAIFWLNADNFVGVVTSETNLPDSEAAELFVGRFPNWTTESIYAIRPTRYYQHEN